jgi:hypothetical protein
VANKEVVITANEAKALFLWGIHWPRGGDEDGMVVRLVLVEFNENL